VLINREMKPDQSHLLSLAPQLVIPINSQITFEASGPGGLRLALMHNGTYYSHYISIIIMSDEIKLGYAMIANVTRYLARR